MALNQLRPHLSGRSQPRDARRMKRYCIDLQGVTGIALEQHALQENCRRATLFAAMQQARDYGDRCPTQEDSYHEPFKLVYPRHRSPRVLVSSITTTTRRLRGHCSLPGLTRPRSLLQAAPITRMKVAPRGNAFPRGAPLRRDQGCRHPGQPTAWPRRDCPEYLSLA